MYYNHEKFVKGPKSVFHSNAKYQKYVRIFPQYKMLCPVLKINKK